MSLWTEEQAKEYFLSGGKDEPSTSVTDVSDSSQAQSADLEAKVQALKGHGNEKLKGKDYEGAAIAYKEAIALCTPAMSETAGAIHSNLSMAQMKLEDPTAALVSAESCVQCRPKWEKGFFRKGEALFALRRYDEAAASYGSGLECKPGDADLSFSLKLAKEAAKGGVWFRQLTPGRDIAISPPSSQVEGLIFGAAKQMRNFIYLVGCATTRGESQESPHATQGPLIASWAFSFDRAGISECVCTRLNVCCFRSPHKDVPAPVPSRRVRRGLLL